MKKEIVLIRHGKVKISDTQRSSSSDLKYWVEQYDIAPLDERSIPSQEVHDSVNSADFLITSKLFRTIESASRFEKTIDEKNELFNEAGVPSVHIPFLKFKAKTWLIILRVLLFTGRGKKDASFQASKERANNCALYLVEHSQKHNKVVLIGHGGMNFFISRILKKQGWRLEARASSKNWGMTKLYKED